MKPIQSVFHLGQIVATRGALDLFGLDIIDVCLRRHASGDWGDVSKEDKEANDRDMLGGGRLLSAFDIRGDRLWIITEADRSATTALLPEEY